MKKTLNSQISEVYTAALKLMVPLSTPETYATIVCEAQKLAGAAYGSIFIFKNRKLERVYSSAPQELQLVPRHDGYTFQAFAQKKALVVDIKQLKKAHPESHHWRAKSVIFIPLLYENFEIGVLTLDSMQAKTLPAQKLEILQLFGSLASLKLRTQMLVTELKTAIETRDLFISMASHELKTPLTTISAYAQLIERSMTANKKIKPEWPTTLRAASNRMTRLINELLHINKIRTGKMMYNFEPSDPAVLLEQAVKDVTLAHPDTQLHFLDLRQTKSLKIWADHDKLTQVFINVLTNAAKFTAADKPITASVENERQKLKIKIVDQGKGIAPENLKHLFEEFYKAAGNTQEGLGLGLFISKKILTAHKGKITVKSKVAVGTQVTILLPGIVEAS